MTDSNPLARRDQLREEAAFWFARMRGEDAETHRAAFEQWLARGALHRSAYNRIAEVFSAGKVLKGRRPAARALPRTHALGIAGALIGGLAALGLWFVQPSSPPASELRQERASTPTFRQIATLLGERRRVALADGSSVLLDRDTLVTIAFSRGERLLRLERGRARFTVAHELRPFRVRAGQAVITAHGTVFDVGLGLVPDVQIRLLRGAIGVRSPSLRTPAEVMLRAGQSITVTPAGGQVLKTGSEDDWPNGRRSFREARLDAIIAEANRGALRKIVLADATLGEMRLSGTFRIDEPERLARQLAVLLALDIAPTEDSIRLSHRTDR